MKLTTYISSAIIMPLLIHEFALALSVLVIVSFADFAVALLHRIKTGEQITSAKLANKSITLTAYLIGVIVLQIVFSPLVAQIQGITSNILMFTPTAILGMIIMREVLSIFEHINSISPLPFTIFKNVNKDYQNK